MFNYRCGVPFPCMSGLLRSPWLGLGRLLSTEDKHTLMGTNIKINIFGTFPVTSAKANKKINNFLTINTQTIFITKYGFAFSYISGIQVSVKFSLQLRVAFVTFQSFGIINTCYCILPKRDMCSKSEFVSKQ